MSGWAIAMAAGQQQWEQQMGLAVQANGTVQADGISYMRAEQNRATGSWAMMAGQGQWQGKGNGS